MSDVRNTVFTALAEATGEDAASVLGSRDLATFDLDSVRMLEFFMTLEDSFDMDIDEWDPDLRKVTTVGDLVDYVSRRLSP